MKRCSPYSSKDILNLTGGKLSYWCLLPLFSTFCLTPCALTSASYRSSGSQGEELGQWKCRSVGRWSKETDVPLSGFISMACLLHVLELQPLLHFPAGGIRLLTMKMRSSVSLKKATRTNSFSHMQPLKSKCFLQVISETIYLCTAFTRTMTKSPLWWTWSI